MAKQERSPGKWYIKIFIGRDKEGKQKFETFTFHGGAREAAQEEARLKLLYSKHNRTTTNLTIAELCDLYMEILDRVLHHCTVINIKGDSYRLKERKEVMKQRQNVNILFDSAT